MNGAIFETYVVSEIIKNYYNAGKRPDIYYYRDVDKREIDLLIFKDDEVCPIEIKKNKLPDSPDKNFKVLNKLGLKVKPGLVICLCDEVIPYNRDCYLCPVSVV